MMQKIKTGAIAFVVLFIVIAVAGYNIRGEKIKKLNAENQRLTLNNSQLLDDSRNSNILFLKEKEVTGRLRRERDSLASALKVKPKQIEKIVYIDNSTHDTVRIQVPTLITGPDQWKIKDSGPCFQWQADAFKIGDSLKIDRTLFQYDNKTTQVFYRKRPFKFLFIRYGRWQNFQQVSSECGGATVQEFNFSK